MMWAAALIAVVIGAVLLFVETKEPVSVPQGTTVSTSGAQRLELKAQSFVLQSTGPVTIDNRVVTQELWQNETHVVAFVDGVLEKVKVRDDSATQFKDEWCTMPAISLSLTEALGVYQAAHAEARIAKFPLSHVMVSAVKIPTVIDGRQTDIKCFRSPVRN